MFWNVCGFCVCSFVEKFFPAYWRVCLRWIYSQFELLFYRCFYEEIWRTEICFSRFFFLSKILKKKIDKVRQALVEDYLTDNSPSNIRVDVILFFFYQLNVDDTQQQVNIWSTWNMLFPIINGQPIVNDKSNANHLNF